MKDVIILTSIAKISSFPRLQVIQEMSSTIRPIRRAAQLAAVRINEFINAENANSDSDESISPRSNNDNGITRARHHGYDDTIFVTRYILDQIENCKYEDEKVQLAEKMFEILNKNPNILIYEPKFRNAVLSKIQEVENHLNNRVTKYQAAKYQDAIKLMKLSMRAHVRNSTMRDNIYKHLDNVSSILKEYEGWAVGTALKAQVLELNNTLKTIKTHPSYVSDITPNVNLVC
jgi:hypothetical protein